MFMEWIKIENYRNLVDVELHFHNDINYFVGENAVGKSNFLDLLEQMMNARGFKKVTLLMYIDRYALSVKCPFLSSIHHFRI